jgi:hypothetical protein
LSIYRYLNRAVEAFTRDEIHLHLEMSNFIILDHMEKDFWMRTIARKAPL